MTDSHDFTMKITLHNFILDVEAQSCEPDHGWAEKLSLVNQTMVEPAMASQSHLPTDPYLLSIVQGYHDYKNIWHLHRQKAVSS